MEIEAKKDDFTNPSISSIDDEWKKAVLDEIRKMNNSIEAVLEGKKEPIIIEPTIEKEENVIEEPVEEVTPVEDVPTDEKIVTEQTEENTPETVETPVPATEPITPPSDEVNQILEAVNTSTPEAIVSEEVTPAEEVVNENAISEESIDTQAGEVQDETPVEPFNPVKTDTIESEVNDESNIINEVNSESSNIIGIDDLLKEEPVAEVANSEPLVASIETPVEQAKEAPTEEVSPAIETSELDKTIELKPDVLVSEANAPVQEAPVVPEAPVVAETPVTPEVPTVAEAPAVETQTVEPVEQAAEVTQIVPETPVAEPAKITDVTEFYAGMVETKAEAAQRSIMSKNDFANTQGKVNTLVNKIAA